MGSLRTPAWSACDTILHANGSADSAPIGLALRSAAVAS